MYNPILIFPITVLSVPAWLCRLRTNSTKQGRQELERLFTKFWALNLPLQCLVVPRASSENWWWPLMLQMRTMAMVNMEHVSVNLQNAVLILLLCWKISVQQGLFCSGTYKHATLSCSDVFQICYVINNCMWVAVLHSRWRTRYSQELLVESYSEPSKHIRAESCVELFMVSWQTPVSLNSRCSWHGSVPCDVTSD